MLTTVLTLSVLVNFVFGGQALAKKFTKKQQQISPVVNALLTSLRNDTDWVFVPKKNDKPTVWVANWNNDRLGIRFTLDKTCGDGGAHMNGKIEHIFNDAEYELISQAIEILKTNYLINEQYNEAMKVN